MRAEARNFPAGDSLQQEVVPMDISDVLTLMISFGMLIAVLMSAKNEK
ncbi:putative holin-like toxin [Lentibacillus sp. JNUCC-1]